MEQHSSPNESMRSARPRVLVWGAMGFIGQHLTETLLARGYSVSVLCRSRSRYGRPWWENEVQWFEIDRVGSLEAFRAAAESSSIIFDLAGSSGAVASNRDPLASLDTNCRVQLEFLQACRDCGQKPRVVFSSSRLVYGDSTAIRFREDHATNPRSIYAVHKLCIEKYLETYARMGFISHTTCRISNAYGEDVSHVGQGYKIINSFILRSLAGHSIVLFGSGGQVRDFIYIKDLVDILIRCGTSEDTANEVLNVGSGTGHSMAETAEIIRALTNGPPTSHRPWPAEYLEVESGDYVADIERCEKLLRFSPRYSLGAGLAETVEAYRVRKCCDGAVVLRHAAGDGVGV